MKVRMKVRGMRVRLGVRLGVGEPPGYECLHGMTGLSIGHGVHGCLLVDMTSLLLPLLLPLAPHWGLLSALLLGGRGGGGGGGDVGVRQLQTEVAPRHAGLGRVPGLLLLTLRAVGQELRYRLPGDKCVLVRHL